jgi:hypothetical protein
MVLGNAALAIHTLSVLRQWKGTVLSIALMVGGDNTRGDYFRFGSVFIKKNNQTEFFLKKKPNRNQVKPTGFGF